MPDRQQRREKGRERRQMRRAALDTAKELLDENPELSRDQLEGLVTAKLEEDFDTDIKAGSAWIAIIMQVIQLLLQFWNKQDD